METIKEQVAIHILDVPEPMKQTIKKKGFPLYSHNLVDMMARQNA